jgi:hypothetical protein
MIRNPETLRLRNLPMRRAIQLDLTEVGEKLREVEAQHAIDVLALESADEAIREDIETLQHG